VFWDPISAAVRLFFNNDSEHTAHCTLAISNVVADIDSTVTFAPDSVAKLTREPDQVYSDVCVEYFDGTKKLYRSRPSTYATYVRRSTTIQRPYTKGLATATAQAEKFLDKHAVETDRITCTIRVPAASAGLVQAGQQISCKFSHLGAPYTSFTWMRIVSCSPRPTDDTGYWYDVALELVYRPTVASVDPCVLEGPTASGHYPALRGFTADATGNVQYGSSCPGGEPCDYYPLPGRIGSWWYPTMDIATGLSPSGYADGGVAGYGSWAFNEVRLLVVGWGTMTVYLVAGDTGHIHATLYHYNPAAGEVQVCTAGLELSPVGTTVVTVPADGFCYHYLGIIGGSADAEAWFAGFDWLADGDAPDTIIDLGPTPGATTEHVVPPAVTDDASAGYTVGSTWIDTATGHAYILVDSSAGAALWVETTSGGVTDHGALTGLTDDDHTQYVLKRYGGKEVVSTVAATGATETIDLANGNVFDETLTADCTFTFAGATAGVACSFTLLLRQDGTGGWTTTWPGSVVWAGGSAPTLDETASTLAVLTFVTLDGGTVWYGFPTGGGGGGTPATTVTDETTWGITPAVGSDTEYARQDHTHGSPAAPTSTGELLVADSPLPVPRGTFSTTAHQTVGSTTTAYAVAFAAEDDKHGLTHDIATNNSRIYVDQPGTYSIIVSAIAHDTAADKQHMALWLAVDGTNVANSNTDVEIATKETEVVVAVAFTYDFTAGQYFELMYRGSATTLRFQETAAGASPTRPASPAVIVAVNMEAPAYGLLTNGPRPLLNEAQDDYLYAG
jgi:hypothetical protein